MNLRTWFFLGWIIFGSFNAFAAEALPSSSLNNFVQQVLENNPAIQAADANVRAAEARYRASSYPLYNPQLGAEGQQSVDKFYAVGINQTIDWANKRGARSHVGFGNLKVAEAELALLRQQLAAEILNAIARLQTAKRVVALAENRTTILQQFVTLTEKRHANGDVARVDVDLAQLALSEALAQEADAKVNLNLALQTLRATSGFMQAAWPSLSAPLPQLSVSGIPIDDLVHHLPLVAVLSNQYVTAEARIRAAIKDRYADPTIGIQGGREDTKEGGHSGLVGLSLSMPLYVRNPYKAEVDAANFDAIVAAQKRMNVIRQARAEIEGTAERYQTLYQTTQRWREISAKPLKDGMVLIERLWKAGEMSTTDYLVQLKQRIDSQIAGAELQGRTWQAWIDWLKASGTVEIWLSHSQRKQRNN